MEFIHLNIMEFIHLNILLPQVATLLFKTDRSESAFSWLQMKGESKFEMQNAQVCT